MVDDHLQEIAAEAKARRVPIPTLLKAANVASSTWWRWRKSKFEPRASTLRRLKAELANLTDQDAA